MGPMAKLCAAGAIGMGGVSLTGATAAVVGADRIADTLSLPPLPKVAPIGPHGLEMGVDLAFRINSAYGAAVAAMFAAGFGAVALEAARRGE